MKKKSTLHTIGIVVSLLFIYLVFRGANLSQIVKYISNLNIPSLILVAVLSVFLVVFKTYRWKMLLDKSDKIPYKTLLPVNFVAHFLNIIFPLRAGEVAQIFLTKAYTDTSRSNIVGSLFLNKFMELISLLILFYSLIIFVSIPIPDFWMRPIKYLLIFTILFLLLFAFNIIDIRKIKHPSNRILSSIYRFFMSLKYIEDKVLLIKSILLSLLVWSIELLMIYILLHAFGIIIPFWATIVIIVGINLAMLIPATSASFGTYEYAIVLVLGMFAISKEQAVAFAIMLHFLEIIFVLALGFVFYLRIKKEKPFLEQNIK
ncbi:MAG: lysylphosphatidylglycerol synthase transmembrane domain-containing protein [Proteobacteria bacterium]|nr:lysylphosphatidylglycerol synthase transmembrane domain-containing protein [Pseudomonadota bacterium]